jgi:hypothetical protein
MISGLVNKEISEELGCHASQSEGASQPRDAEDWRSLRGGTGETGVGRRRRARAAQHSLNG